MRRAVTLLLQSLGVIVVVAVVIVLILPAGVREARDRVVCMNHLKQVGLAAHSFHDTHGHFPPGTAPDTNLPAAERLSFYAALLPYLEQEAAYRKLAPAAAWDAEPNRVAAGVARGADCLFRCPEWAKERGGAAGHLAVTNYVGVAGAGTDAAALPAGAPGAGVFGYDRTTRFDDVTDGTGNTLLAIETGSEVGPWLRGGPATVRPIDPALGHLTGDGRPFGGTHFREGTWFRPARPSGFYVLLADATTRYELNEIQPGVLAALATVAGKEQLSDDW
jgi:hypothetical protein